jgi:hypothetical protein
MAVVYSWLSHNAYARETEIHMHWQVYADAKLSHDLPPRNFLDFWPVRGQNWGCSGLHRRRLCLVGQGWKSTLFTFLAFPSPVFLGWKSPRWVGPTAKFWTSQCIYKRKNLPRSMHYALCIYSQNTRSPAREIEICMHFQVYAFLYHAFQDSQLYIPL